MTGQTVLHYEVLEELGRGESSLVYKAYDTRQDAHVVLKFFVQSTETEKLRQRFIHAAELASELDHPNISAVSAALETADGHPFMVMSYYEGQTLTDLLDDDPMPLKRALDIVVQCSRALAYAHSRQLVHRDIKPDNIFLTSSGTVKLLDFGIAKSELTDLHRRTSVGTLLGTVPYMAPEQIRGETVDARADLWSVGVMLYEMLAARHPFSYGDLFVAIDAVVNRYPVPLETLRPDLPGEVVRIVNRLLAKPVAERYDSAAVLLQDLEAQLAPLSKKRRKSG